MSTSPVQDLQAAHDLSSDSGHTLPSRPLQPNSDPAASKRVCFYRSGDYKFSGHRMVINGRTFKTFDALLDALSKKVPLPFGVRTITTPRGIRLVKGLEDLHDGGSYVCSDQRRVKPLNLAEVNRRQVPWNATRPLSTGWRRRRQFGQLGRNDMANRLSKVTERVTVRTPKRLLVIKNKDPTMKRTIVLQRKTAPTFDALLDYLSQILEFPVLKLFSTDGRRVDGLAALILCSGVVVAAGNEGFRLGNYSFHRTGQTFQSMYIEHLESSTIQPGPPKDNNKSISSGRGSRNFSLSSERHIVNQINTSKNGGTNSHMYQHHESCEMEVNRQHTAVAPRGSRGVDTEHQACILPHDDDIEKSFRVNQDGSMTVEMKVRLTIKEEEMLQWTTTLSRHCLRKRTVCASISESANSSPDSNAAIAKDTSSLSEGGGKEGSQPNGAAKGVCLNDKHAYNSYSPEALGKAKAHMKRTPTPGTRHVHKKASVGSVKMVTESGVQESSQGHYSYMERMADGETTEGFCVVRHSSSSSSRPIPKPRRTASSGKGNKGSHSSIKTSGVAEVLQIQNTGMEVTETVMHIYESQGCYDNYFVNEEYSADGAPLHGSTTQHAGRVSGESGPCSSSNDCDIDFSRQPPTEDSQPLREEMLSLSSEPMCPRHEVMNNLSTVTEDDAQTATNSHVDEPVKQDKPPKSEECKKMVKSTANHKNSASKKSKHSSSDKLSSNTSMGRKSLGSHQSGKSDQKGKVVERKVDKPQTKKTTKDEKTTKSSALSDKAENVKTPPKRQTTSKLSSRENGHNVNTPSGRPPMKKNISDILQSKKSSNLPSRKTVSKPKSISENRTATPKKSTEFNESVSMPSLNPTPSEIHQYVQNWLESVSQDQDPYDEAAPAEAEPPSKVVFQIGGETDDERNGCQDDSSGSLKKSASCRSVPLYHQVPERSLLGTEQKTLCASMPSVRVDEFRQGNQLKTHKSAEAIGQPTNDSVPSNSLSPKDKIRPVLRQLCSSFQNIRRLSDTNTTSDLEKCNSLPDFPTQVGSVFGSSYKAFLSFLSVMTLRDHLAGSAQVDTDPSRSSSEAMLMMQSLLKISAIEDKEEQRVSLTELQSRTSSQLRDRWKDFQILRERLESEPLSPKVSETEFALEVVSEGGDIFEEDPHLSIEELMGELNMPQDLRAEISSTIQHVKRFYPTEESTVVDMEKNQSESEEDVEKCFNESQCEAESMDPDDTCLKENNSRQDQGDGAVPREFQPEEADGAEVDVKDSEIAHTEISEGLTQKEVDEEQEVDKDTEDKKTGDEEEEASIEDSEDQEKERGSAEESVEKDGEGTEEEMTADEEEEGTGEGVVEDREDVGMEEGNHNRRQEDSFVETDEREGVDETEKEETRGTDGVEEEEKKDEQESGDEEKQVEIGEEEADQMIKADGKIVLEDTEEEGGVVEVEYRPEEDAEAFIEEEGDVEENITDFIPEEEEEESAEKEETDEVDEVDNIIEEVDEEEEQGEEEEGKAALCSQDETVERENTERSLEEVEETHVGDIESEDMMEVEDRLDEDGAHGQPVGSHEFSSEDHCDEAEGCDHLLEEALYLKNTESLPKSFSEGQSEQAEGMRTDEGAELRQGHSVALTHPVEISQELLDFVNSALLSSSLTFTYDARGNIQIEQDYARIVQTKPNISKRRRDSSSYEFKRLPSPNTSDLSDYRPDTSESGGYKTQDSIDIVTESGEEAWDRASPDFTPKSDAPRVETDLNLASPEEERLQSYDSGTKASKEDLSYFSASSSLKADTEAAYCLSLSSEKDTADGVLIDRGRWLLKENHLIRKSPPVPLGMYADVDSTSSDTAQENNAEDLPLGHRALPNPLVAISSSELEDMAKPLTPKCTYFNMPHGSDSDPFQDDFSLHSVNRDLSSATARGSKVSPTIDTSRTWPNKVGSLSSFASVEFKLPDGRVHPEGEPSTVAQPRGTSRGAGNALQAHDSLETLHDRCGRYCPIL